MLQPHRSACFLHYSYFCEIASWCSLKREIKSDLPKNRPKALLITTKENRELIRLSCPSSRCVSNRCCPSWLWGSEWMMCSFSLMPSVKLDRTSGSRLRWGRRPVLPLCPISLPPYLPLKECLKACLCLRRSSKPTLIKAPNYNYSFYLQSGKPQPCTTLSACILFAPALLLFLGFISVPPSSPSFLCVAEMKTKQSRTWSLSHTHGGRHTLPVWSCTSSVLHTIAGTKSERK